MFTNGNQLLTAAEVAQRLRISPWMIYSHVRNGVFPPGVFVRFRRAIRFNQRELEAWLLKGGGQDTERKAVQ